MEVNGYQQFIGSQSLWNIFFCVLCQQKKLVFQIEGLFLVILGSSKNIVLKMEQWNVSMDVIQ